MDPYNRAIEDVKAHAVEASRHIEAIFGLMSLYGNVPGTTARYACMRALRDVGFVVHLGCNRNEVAFDSDSTPRDQKGPSGF